MRRWSALGGPSSQTRTNAKQKMKKEAAFCFLTNFDAFGLLAGPMWIITRPFAGPSRSQLVRHVMVKHVFKKVDEQQKVPLLIQQSHSYNTPQKIDNLSLL